MKLKNVAVVAAALALAVGMTACGGSASSTTASSVASSAAASSEAASSEAASSEAEVESAEYTVYNTTGENVTDLYLYVAGSEDKGENLAADGLADGDSVVLTLPEDADKSAEYVLEFTTEDGNTQTRKSGIQHACILHASACSTDSGCICTCKIWWASCSMVGFPDCRDLVTDCLTYLSVQD